MLVLLVYYTYGTYETEDDLISELRTYIYIYTMATYVSMNQAVGCTVSDVSTACIYIHIMVSTKQTMS